MRKRFLIKIRIFLQLSFWFYFIFLIIYSRDTVARGEFYNIFPKLSIHMGITSSIASGSIITEYWPALVIILLTLVLGRFFCGWICPMGSTIDVSDKLSRREEKYYKKRYVKKIVLLISLILSIFGIQFGGLFDPLSIVTRIYVIVIYPFFDLIVKSFFNMLYEIPFVNVVSEFIFKYLKATVLDFNDISFTNFYPVLFIIIIFIVLSFITKRFWCRYLCPLGAVYSLFNRVNLFKRFVDKSKCTNCMKCVNDCPMNAIYDKGVSTHEGECIKCFECLNSCNYDAISFDFLFYKKKNKGKKVYVKKDENNNDINISRRNLLSGILMSVTLLPVFKLFANEKNSSTPVIRPPGALAEDKFQEKCIRCGQCMKVCPTNGLHPVILQSGLSGIFTPNLVPRIGYCEYNCNLCSEVCPTGAIEKYKKSEKANIKIGTAYINRHLCLPWADNVNCLVCEEMCPVPTKAIKIEERSISGSKTSKKIMLPVVDMNLCIGCGICENKCPVEGNAAIRVRRIKL